MIKQLPNGYSDYSLQLLHKDCIEFWLTGGQVNAFGTKDEPLCSSTGEPLYLYPYHTEALDRDLQVMTHKFNLQNDDYWNARFSVCNVSLIYTKKNHIMRLCIGGFVFDNTGIIEGAIADFDIVCGLKPDLAVVTYDPGFINTTDYLRDICPKNPTYSRRLEQNVCDEFGQFVNKCNNVPYQKLIDKTPINQITY